MMAIYYRTHNAIKWFTRNVTTDFQERLGNPIKNINLYFNFQTVLSLKSKKRDKKKKLKKLKQLFLKNTFSLGGDGVKYRPSKKEKEPPRQTKATRP